MWSQALLFLEHDVKNDGRSSFVRDGSLLAAWSSRALGQEGPRHDTFFSILLRMTGV